MDLISSEWRTTTERGYNFHSHRTLCLSIEQNRSERVKWWMRDWKQCLLETPAADTVTAMQRDIELMPPSMFLSVFLCFSGPSQIIHILLWHGISSGGLGVFISLLPYLALWLLVRNDRNIFPSLILHCFIYSYYRSLNLWLILGLFFCFVTLDWRSWCRFLKATLRCGSVSLKLFTDLSPVFMSPLILVWHQQSNTLYNIRTEVLIF